MAGTQGAIRAGRAFVEVFADKARFRADLRACELYLRAFGSSVRMMGLKLTALGLAFKAPFYFAIKTFSDFGSELYIMSKRIGVSVEDLSVLRYQAELTGIDMGYLEVAFRRMANALAEAQAGGKEAQKNFAQLGLSIQDLAGMGQMERYQAMIEAFGNVADESAKINLATRFFGRGGTRAMAMIKMQIEGYEKIKKVMQEYGVIVTDSEAKQAMAFRNEMVTLKLVAEHYLFTLGKTLVPLLKKVSRWLIDVMIRTRDWITANSGLIVSALKIAVYVTGAGIALTGLGTAIRFVSTGFRILNVAFGVVHLALSALMAICTPLIAILGAVASAILPIVAIVGVGVAIITVVDAIAQAGREIKELRGPIDDIEKSFNQTADDIKDSLLPAVIGYGKTLVDEFKNAVNGLKSNLSVIKDMFKKSFGDIKKVVISTFEGIRDALAAGDVQLAADIFFTGLELAWAKGIQPLKELWSSFTFSLSKKLSEAQKEILTIWVDAQQLMTKKTIDTRPTSIKNVRGTEDFERLAKMYSEFLKTRRKRALDAQLDELKKDLPDMTTLISETGKLYQVPTVPGAGGMKAAVATMRIDALKKQFEEREVAKAFEFQQKAEEMAFGVLLESRDWIIKNPNWEALEADRRLIKETFAKGALPFDQAAAEDLVRIQLQSEGAQQKLTNFLDELKAQAEIEKWSISRPEIPPFDDETRTTRTLPQVDETFSRIEKSLGAFEVPTLQGFLAVPLKKSEDYLSDIADNTEDMAGGIEKLTKAVGNLEGMTYDK